MEHTTTPTPTTPVAHVAPFTFDSGALGWSIDVRWPDGYPCGSGTLFAPHEAAERYHVVECTPRLHGKRIRYALHTNDLAVAPRRVAELSESGVDAVLIDRTTIGDAS